MLRNLVSVTGVTVLLGLTLACTSKSSTPLTPTTPGSAANSTASDGSTLKVTAPTPQSPLNDVKPTTGPAKLVVGASTAPYLPVVIVKYRFQIFNSANVLVDNSLRDGLSYEVQAELVTNSRYTWQARAEAGNDVGPWSTRASFTAPETAFLGASTFDDPLKNGRTVGIQRGGVFVPGQGWRALTTRDGIDYDLTQGCTECILEFDVTGFGRAEGQFVEKDLKWITMGDASTFGDFGAFRNHPWKMHLEQRSDGDGTGMKITWRNGGFGEGDPGDHVVKMDPAVDWQTNQVFHFRLEWDGGGFGVYVNGVQWFAEGFTRPFAPPNHRVSLGCWPRDETMFGVYSNVILRKK